MRFYQTTTPDAAEKKVIFKLWNNEYPEQLAFLRESELENYLRALSKPTHYFAQNDQHEIIGWSFTFERDWEIWFAIIVDHSFQKQEIGSRLLTNMKAQHTILNGWVTDHNLYCKKDGEAYISPMNFYLGNNFIICSEVRLETEKLSAVKIKWVKKD